MKRLTYVFIAIMLIIIPMSVEAGIAEGQKIFKKKLRKSCKFSGIKFARKHTQAEWEQIKEQGLFKEETKKICPKLKIETIDDSLWPDIYEFVYEYGWGSGNIPSC